MQLRDYQQTLVNDVYAQWAAGHRNVLAQLATGGGKSVVIGTIIREHAGASVVMAHRTELVSQLSLTLARLGIRHTIVAPRSTIKDIVATHCADLGRSYYDPHAQCSVASVQTLARLPAHSHLFTSATLVVCDEAHHYVAANVFGRACSRFVNARGLFPTATPVRADGLGLGRHADGLVDAMVVGPSMRELISAGHLCDYRVFAPTSDLDLSTVGVGASGEYSQAPLRAAVHKSRITGDIVAEYLRIAPGKRGVTFTVDIASAAEVAAEFRAAGVRAEVISSKTPAFLRQKLMREFRVGEILQLVNVGILGEGVDVPAIEVVSMGGPTQSYCNFAQQFGRALRIYEGKQHALIIDHVGNTMRHNVPDAARVWSLDRRERRSRTTPDDAIPLKTCIKCLSVYTRFARSCPYCMYYAPPSSRAGPEFVDGDLHELDTQTLERMRGAIADSERTPKLPRGVEPYVHQGILNRHRASMDAQQELRAAIADWAGVQHAAGHDDSTIYRMFYITFGVDVLTAQTLKRADAITLKERIA